MARVYNISALQTFLTCPRLYSYKEDMRLVHTGENRNALDVGTRVHAGALVLNKGGTLGEALSTACELEQDTADGLGWAVTDAGIASDCVKALDSFMKTANLGLTVHLAEEECVFTITDPAGMIHILGRPDAIVSSERHPGGYWHLQYKTVGHTTSPEIYFRSYELAFHEVAYALMGERLGYYPMLGSIVILIRKTKRPSCFIEVFPLTDQRRKDTIQSICQIVEFIESGSRPMNPLSCVRYNRVCSFMTNCLGASFVDELVVDSPNYVDEARVNPEKLRALLEKRREE